MGALMRGTRVSALRKTRARVQRIYGSVAHKRTVIFVDESTDYGNFLPIVQSWPYGGLNGKNNAKTDTYAETHHTHPDKQTRL
ncbi:MAG: hypothetical protein AAFU63_08425 [Pseudomonadota bacterium]